jgi:hypothetical protein
VAKRKLLPPIRKPGALNDIAAKLGYEKTSDVPIKLYPEFARLLVREYGKMSALGMIRWQINIRSRIRRRVVAEDRKKFVGMFNYIAKHY